MFNNKDSSHPSKRPNACPNSHQHSYHIMFHSCFTTSAKCFAKNKKSTSVSSNFMFFFPKSHFSTTKAIAISTQGSRTFSRTSDIQIYQTMSIHLDFSRLLYTSTRLLLQFRKKKGNPSSHVFFYLPTKNPRQHPLASNAS